MSVSWEPDNAFEALKKNSPIISSCQSANEATTRLRAIDTVLFEVLRWDKTLVDTEKYCRDVGYADYAFKQGDGLCLILEAKKDGETFLLPERPLSDRVIGFGLLEAECPAAGKAMRQACGYAASEGARYVGITNGTQWLLALAYVQGQAIENRVVFAFRSIDDILARFDRFWTCFSPVGVYSNSVANLLMESRKAPAPPKLSTRIANYPVPASRNTVINSLEAVISLIWDQLNADETDAHFLRECYVQPETTSENLVEAKELIQQRIDTDSSVTPDAHSITDIPDLINSYQAERPIIILGRIGHGKSTFLRYLRLVGAADSLAKYVQIDVDFLDRPEHSHQVTDFVYGQIEEQLRTRYDIDVDEDKIVRSALHGDLNRFRKSPIGRFYANDETGYAKEELNRILELQKDRHAYLTKVFYMLKKSQGRSIALFFDNLDRRSDAIQEEAFLRSSAIARDWTSLVFVCLRHGTFYRSSFGGTLDTVAPKTLTVAPPPIDVLLRKRLKYAAKVARGEESFKGGRATISKGFTIHLPQTAEVLDCAAESLFRSAPLRNLFNAVANGNIRELLRYVRAALTSTHFNTTKILAKLKQGSYRISVHETLRALLFGDSIHYEPEASTFVNLFDVERADPAEHFSRLLTLDFLIRIPQTTPAYGYARIEDVIQYLCQLGYTHEHASKTLNYLNLKNCCESQVPDQPLVDGSKLRITSLGEYHIQELAGHFNYFDAIVVDTPIIDNRVRKEMADVVKIDDRLIRAITFVDYLKAQAANLQDSNAARLITDILDKASREIEGIAAELHAKESAGKAK